MCFSGWPPTTPCPESAIPDHGQKLAPLFGIIRDPLTGGHRGPINLIHGTPNR